MDPSTVLEGDALTPVLAAFDDPTVVGAGWRGVAVQDGWRAFADAGPGEVEALLGYLFAVRRCAALQVPLPAEGALLPQRRHGVVVPAARGRRPAGRAAEARCRCARTATAATTTATRRCRDQESKKTYDRFLQRFRGREDLRLPR